MNTIRNRILYVIVITILITVVSLGIFNYRDAQRLAIDIIKENNKNELQNISDYYFEKLITDMEFIVEKWANSEKIVMYQKAYGQPKIVSDIPQNFIDIYNEWGGLTSSLKDISWLYYGLEEDGSIFISPIDNTMPSNYDARRRNWYISAVSANGATVWTEPYVDAGGSGKILQTISKAVYREGDLIGVVGLDIELEKFAEIVSNLKFAKKSEIYLINSKNVVLAHNLSSDSPVKQEILSRYNIPDISEIVNIEGSKYVISVVPMKINGWRLTAITKTDIEDQLDSIRRKVFIFMLIMSFAALVVGTGLSNMVLSPLYQLIDSTKHISDGHFHIKTNLKSTDEFGELSRSFDKLLSELNSNYISTVKVLANAIEASDQYTRGHCDRVGKISSSIARHIGLSQRQMENLEFACILHDVGKIGIPNSILNKPGKLTTEEIEKIKLHPVIGYEMIKDVNFLKEPADILLQHHERVDGMGYPAGLMDDEIRIEAKILCVADVYDAMTSVRIYRKFPLTQEQVREELINSRGTQLDSSLVDILIEIIDSDESFN